MSNEENSTWVSAHRQITLEIRGVDQIPEGMEIHQFAREGIAKGATYTVTERRAQGFAHWQPAIMARCPLDMSWGAGIVDPAERTDMHRLFAGWIWDEINEELAEGTIVVDLRYAGPTGCDGDECVADDCVLMWDVIDSTGSVHRVNVPI